MKWDEIYDKSKHITNETMKSVAGEAGSARMMNEKEERIVRRLQDSDYLYSALKARKRYDYRKAFQALKKKQQRRHNLRLIAVSAAAACVIWATCLMIFQYGERLNEPLVTASQKEMIEPGQVKAILKKANGEEVTLDSRSRLLGENDGAMIAVDSVGLQYEVKDSVVNDSIVYNTLTVPRGGVFNLTLADGTKVWLNADSKLVYPVVFSGDTREVQLVGEAYFDVTKDAGKPFVVATDLGKVRVLGTQFNVKAYPEEASIITTLVSGSVSFTNKRVENTKLSPGHQLIFSEVSGRVDMLKVNVQNYVGWRDNQLSFQNETLENIMRILARWYDVDAVFMDESLKHVEFSGNLDKYVSIDTFFKLFELGADVRFEVKGRTIFIRKK